MSELVYSRTDSGLVLAETSADEAAVARALTRIDPNLKLVRMVDLEFETWVWKVYLHFEDNRPPLHILTWAANGTGEPYPLSFRLVEEVQRQDKESRGRRPDEDELNARRREELQKEAEDFHQDVLDDYKQRARRLSNCFPRTSGLSRGRRAMRKKGWNV